MSFLALFRKTPGQQAVHAILRGDVRLMRQALDAGCDPNMKAMVRDQPNFTYKQQKSLLGFAISELQDEIVGLLLERGARFTQHETHQAYWMLDEGTISLEQVHKAKRVLLYLLGTGGDAFEQASPWQKQSYQAVIDRIMQRFDGTWVIEKMRPHGQAQTLERATAVPETRQRAARL